MATTLQMGASIYDLEEAELCYAPQFGGADQQSLSLGKGGRVRAWDRHANGCFRAGHTACREEGDKAENQLIYQENGITIRAQAAIRIADLVMDECFLTPELMVKYSVQSPMGKEKNNEYT